MDGLHRTCARIFVVGRALRKLILCRYNNLTHRFLAYFFVMFGGVVDGAEGVSFGYLKITSGRSGGLKYGGVIRAVTMFRNYIQYRTAIQASRVYVPVLLAVKAQKKFEVRGAHALVCF